MNLKKVAPLISLFIIFGGLLVLMSCSDPFGKFNNPSDPKNSSGTPTTVQLGSNTSTTLPKDNISTTTVPIHVDSVALNATSLNLIAHDGTAALIPTISPSNASDTTVSWASDNPAVATVSASGVVMPLGSGTATVTVTTDDGAKTATCTIMVAVYTVGQPGPDGGLIFYDSIAATGANFNEAGVSCRYLEAAPVDQGSVVNGNPWETVGPITIQTATNIGSGFTNTQNIINQPVGTSAASLCNAYTGGGKTDWFLPSKDELNLMYTNLQSTGLVGFNTTGSGYWSSSQNGSGSTAWYQTFAIGNSIQSTYSTLNYNFFIRAARAF